MSRAQTSRLLTRRHLLAVTAGGLTSSCLGGRALAQATAAAKGTIRDRLWIFTFAANSDLPHIGRRSVMTPAEGAFYLGVPNIIVVQSSESEARYGRLEPPFAQYTVALRPLKQVVWSVVGSGGFQSPVETKEVLELAGSTPNFAGIMLDDFFTGQKEGKRAQLTVRELAELRRQLERPRSLQVGGGTPIIRSRKATVARHVTTRAHGIGARRADSSRGQCAQMVNVPE